MAYAEQVREQFEADPWGAMQKLPEPQIRTDIDTEAG
jgi:hypothetical protein